ncbi:MAG: DUF5824 family protein [Candidatus Kariarchaeaceae archaeon]
MPLPSRREDESRENFVSRCMSDPKVSKEFPSRDQKLAVCMSKASEGLPAIAQADFKYNVEELGYTEDLNEDNFYIPTEAEYVDFGEPEEDWDIAVAKPGLWENIRRKKEREGKNYKPAKTEKEGRPTQDQLKRAQEKEICGCGGNDDADACKCKAEYLGYAEYAEADKPGKNDPRRTPAPKKDQKKGSKKNKPDSAKNPSGKITFSKETTAKLSAKVKEHNAKGKGSKATLGMLKAVYRRGAGAFSTSHAPKMSRDGWAMARVNAFLTLLRTGKPSNSAYTQDNDLLPKGHPKKSKAMVAYSAFKYENPKTGEVFTYNRKGNYKKDGTVLVYRGEAAKYKGRTVKLGKPFRTPDGPKKFSVYVKNDKGNVVKVNFGDPNMEIKKDNPARRKSFRARHKCDTNPGPRWKARYWSCRKW